MKDELIFKYFTEAQPELIRLAGGLADKIRVQFKVRNNTKNLIVQLGHVVCQRVGFTSQSRCTIWPYNHDPKHVLLLMPCTEGLGTKLTKLANSNNLVFQRKWDKDKMGNDLPIPDELAEGQQVYANYELFRGGIALFLPGHNKEDRTRLLTLIS